MKKYLIGALAVLFIEAIAGAVWFYKDSFGENNYKNQELTEFWEELDKCDKTANEKLENVITNADMKNFTYDRNNCYKAVGNKIIDKYYAKHATELKKNLTEFLSASYAVNADIYLMRDSCYNGCGTMFFPIYVNDAGEDLRNVITRYINMVEIDNINMN